MESFNTSETEVVQYKVVHVQGNETRMENITENVRILNQPIVIFNAVRGDDLDRDDINGSLRKLDPHMTNVFDFKPKNINQLGCYMSHVLLLRSLFETPVNVPYTVVFEDDFHLAKGMDTHGEIIELLKTMEEIDPDFDLLFMGVFGDPCDTMLTTNPPQICSMNKNVVIYGTHGYIVNNKKAKHIYDNLHTITTVIDVKYFDLIREGTLKGYFIKPFLVNQNLSFGTTILGE
jgi:GR25 family glycosyltransferase involved in LPS biosynthesis